MSSSMWNYVVNNQTVGPVSEEQLKGLVRAGQLSSDTLVWNESMSNWAPFSQVFPAAAPAPAAPRMPAQMAPMPASSGYPASAVEDMVRHMKFVGLFIIIVGGFYCLSIIGAIVGVPIIFCGMRAREAADAFLRYHQTQDPNALSMAFDLQRRFFFIQKVFIIIGLVFFVLYIVFLIIILATVGMHL